MADKKKDVVKDLAKAFFATPAEEEVEVKKPAPKKSSKSKKPVVKASDVAASIRKRQQLIAQHEDEKTEKVVETPVSDAAPKADIANIEETKTETKKAVAKTTEVKKEEPKAEAKKAEPKKTESKKTETKKEAVKVVKKEEPKAEVKKAAPKKAEPKKAEPVKKADPKKAETVKKAEPKKEVAKKEESKAEVKKTTPKKAEPAKKEAPAKKAIMNVLIEYKQKQYDEASIVAKAEAVWTKELRKKASELKNLEIYIKPEDGRVYYVFNGKIQGDFEI